MPPRHETCFVNVTLTLTASSFIPIEAVASALDWTNVCFFFYNYGIGCAFLKIIIITIIIIIWQLLVGCLVAEPR